MFAIVAGCCFALPAVEPIFRTTVVETQLRKPLIAAGKEFGTPQQLRVYHIYGSRDVVELGFGSFGLLGQMQVEGCFFTSGWSDAVYGIRVGDGFDSVVAVLGEAARKVNPDQELYEWQLRPQERKLWALFDDGRKLVRLEMYDYAKRWQQADDNYAAELAKQGKTGAATTTAPGTPVGTTASDHPAAPLRPEIPARPEAPKTLERPTPPAPLVRPPPPPPIVLPRPMSPPPSFAPPQGPPKPNIDPSSIAAEAEKRRQEMLKKVPKPPSPPVPKPSKP